MRVSDIKRRDCGLARELDVGGVTGVLCEGTREGGGIRDKEVLDE